MSDTPTNNKATEIPPNTKSLDELFAAAERHTPVVTAASAAGEKNGSAGVADAQVTNAEPVPAADACTHPDTLPPQLSNCSICHKIICYRCASQMDPICCKDCLSEESVTMKESPLVDQDGVTHEGRLLTPGPTFNTLARSIADMTTSELEQHIARYKSLIKQAETALDFRRVSLGMAQVEMAQRDDQRRRRLRGVKLPAGARKVTVADPSKPAPAKPVDMSRMLKMIEALQQLQKLKKQQAATATTKPTPTAVSDKPQETKL